MHNANPRVSLLVWLACLFFGLSAATIGVIGGLGVRSATATGEQIATNELTTLSLTAQLGRDVDAIYLTGQTLPLVVDPVRRAKLLDTLSNQQIPTIESDLAAVEAIHAADGPSEKAQVDELVSRWSDLRRLLNASRFAATSTDRTSLDSRLEAAYEPLSAQVVSLFEGEAADAKANQGEAGRLSTRITWALVSAVALALLAAVGAGWAGSRVMRRAVEPAKEQVDFTDSLQLAEDEGEAHRLLHRHLERSVADASVTVLNRNNSADRLEAVTQLPADSPLRTSLQHAEPRSCLAVRSGRTHEEGGQVASLLGCLVCGGCPGRSTCTPLTVGGEVIGSVLVNRSAAYTVGDLQRIRDSVSQAAPVLANLRNLAIAELRAATDSLTGLPNKRAVADTVKRMLAQSLPTRRPLSLLMLDLDHFRDINERFGHPAGDQALANVGAALRSALRDSDFAGRNGGEEFVVILPDTDLSGAIVVAEAIRATIAEISLPGLDLRVTASVGIAAYPDHATSAERLERFADAALYVAKRSGRNRIEIAAPATEPAEEPAPEVKEAPGSEPFALATHPPQVTPASNGALASTRSASP